MRKLIIAVLVLISLDSFAQPTNYTWYKQRIRQYSLMLDSMLYIPRYNGTPSGVRANENSAIDGAIAVDTANGRQYFYYNGSWRRLANYSELGVDSIWREAGKDSIFYSKGGNTYKIKDSVGAGGGLGMKVRRSLEIISDSSQLLNDSASFASGAVKVYGYDTTRGWKNAAKIVLISPQDKDGLRYKSSNSTWVNYSLVQKRLQFQVDTTTNSPASGDSTLTHAYFLGKHLRVYREGLMQTQDDTTEGFELSDSVLTVHPPWVSGERIIIETSDTTVWGELALQVPPTPPVDSSWVNITIGTNVQLTNTDSVWSSTVGAGSGWGNYGLSGLKLPAGQDGGIRFKYTGSDGQYGLIGVRTSNTNSNYTSWDAGVGLVGASFYYIESGSPAAAGGTASVGDYIVLRRVGSTLKMQKSSDGGATYTDLYTFTFTSSADLYILINCYEAQKLRFPRGLNIE